MVNVDATIVNVALPLMQRSFGLPLATLQWAATAYLLVITGVLPLTEQLAAWVGRRRMLVIGVGAFTLGSVLAALAPDFPLLLASRVVQGLGGAVIQANVMAIVALIFPQSERGRALGMIGAVVAAGSLAGPSLGGFLTAFFSWRSVFWVNLPIGVWGTWAVSRYLPLFPRDTALRLTRLDWPGAAMFFLLTATLQLALASLTTTLGAYLVLATAVLLVIFLAFERSHAHPVVRLHLFRRGTFSRNLLSGIAWSVLMMFPAFLLPFYLRGVLREPMWLVGLSLVPQALGNFFVSPLGGRIADRHGVLLPGRLGFLLYLLADLALALPQRAPLWEIWIFSAATGVASGLIMAPNNSAILNSVPSAETGLASAMIATQRNLGRNVGVALAALAPTIYWAAIGAGSPSIASPAYPQLFLGAFRAAFLVVPVFALVGIALLSPPKPPLSQVAEAATGAGHESAIGADRNGSPR
jgi:EmrB/QacA subfamily drug resistance transporter